MSMKKLSEFRSAIKHMFAKRFFRITAGLSLVLFLLSIILPAWQLLPGIKEQIAIPLHYNIHLGVDLYGVWWRIFTISLIGLIILIVNFVLSGAMWSRDKVISHYLWIASVISELILLVAITFVILLNLTYV